jgi:serine protease AprX
MAHSWGSTAPTPRRQLAAVAAVAASAALLTAPSGVVAGAAAPPTAATRAAPAVSVIVQASAGASAAAAEAVVRIGGTVGRQLGVIEGFAARVPADAIGELRGAASVRAVTADERLRPQGYEWLPDKDVGSLYSVTKWTGAHDAWSRSDAQGRKVTGKGIGVALIDSGIVPVKGLNTSGKVVQGPDLSFESQSSNLRHLDTYGHGTHMAGIIAGRDPEVSDGNENDSKYFVGVAPGAHIVNLKVAAADGAVDVSQVIAAIDWVVAHRNDPGLNIRVLNLSYGTNSTQDPRLDPLSYAAEVAWRKGIVVVAAGGNDGLGTQRLLNPAVNPYVMAVSAVDHKGTEKRDDDAVASFSNRGNPTRRPDLAAPGRSIVGLRAPGSYIDTHYPSGLVSGDTAQRLFRGSGTSQAAAVVSGAAALLLQERPSLTPDQVKRLFTSTADKMPQGDTIAQGAGQLDIKQAVETGAPSYRQTWTVGSGTGTLEGARGTSHVADMDTGEELRGELDIMGQTWHGRAWADDTWAGRAWAGENWNGRAWAGRAWAGNNWAGRAWAGRAWADAYWTGHAWAGRAWAGRAWAGRAWAATLLTRHWG